MGLQVSGLERKLARDFRGFEAKRFGYADVDARGGDAFGRM